jgi:hypothetical protein
MAEKNRNRGRFEDAQREYEQVLGCEPNNREARQGIMDTEVGVLNRKSAAGDFSGAEAGGRRPQGVERYPMLDCPDAVPPNQEFAIQVSLTEQQLTPEAKIEGGDATPEGKLSLPLPPTQDATWNLDVVLTAPGLQFTRGTNVGSIELPRQGDATSAIFYAKAGANAAARGQVHVLASYWFKGGYLARVGRDIQIESVTPALTLKASPSRRVEYTAAIAYTSAEFRDQSLEPDLTLFIKDDGITINSPFLQPASGRLKDSKGFADWLQQNFWDLANIERGSELITTAHVRSNERAEGFGQLLYAKYAPDVFKSAFWTLVNKRGKNFRTIQIYSDNPQIPWELMRPVREDGTGQQNFLGLDYSIARWHVTDDGIQRDRPPNSETMQQMFVIAPRYTGSRSLDGEATEIQGLARLNGYSAVNGNMNALRELFHHPPQGIVHFAGHGELSRTGGDFAILLEDGELDTTTWRGIAKADSSNHTFFFFNACDVGQAKHSGNFVDGWAPAVLDAGASGYIGALWPVNDQIAAQFAVHFYQLLQEQMRVGPADVSATLERTRREIYQTTGNPTALAYVLYGDTNLRFTK